MNLKFKNQSKIWVDGKISTEIINTKTGKKVAVDGIVFYDLAKENETLATIQKERAELINLMLDAKNKGMKTQMPKKKETGHYHCDTLGEYCKESHYKHN